MGGAAPVRRERDAGIECLRILAAVGIAAFHAFLPWDVGEVLRALGGGSHPALVLLLGLASLLGAFGNHVFFLLSGYFLVPACAEEPLGPATWAERLGRAGRRAGRLLEAVAFWWAVVAVVVPLVAPDAERVWLSPSWLATGLEFVWLYVVAVLLSPLLGWAHARRRSRVPLVAAGVAIYLVNAYIAFVSPDDAARGLLQWRKLMSGVTYLYSFCFAAAIRDAVARGRDGAQAPFVPLALAAAATLAAEGIVALCQVPGLADALSYKSTSLLSFALAAGAVYLVGCRAAEARGRRRGRAADLVCHASRGVIGFYVLQSLTWNLWNPPLYAALGCALGAGGPVAFLLAGTLLAAAMVAACLALDACVRRPIFHAARLAWARRRGSGE